MNKQIYNLNNAKQERTEYTTLRHTLPNNLII